MKSLISALQKHSTHTIDCVETPTKLHYAKMCCRDCGNKFLLWVGPHEMKAMGYWTDQQATQQIKLKRKLKNKQHKSKTPKWSQATSKERNFYTNYQPPSFNLPRTPSQLIGDRLAITGISKYNGNSIYSIPIEYLQTLLAGRRINKPEDRQLIEQAIQVRQEALKETGAYSGPPEGF